MQSRNVMSANFLNMFFIRKTIEEKKFYLIIGDTIRQIHNYCKRNLKNRR